MDKNLIKKIFKVTSKILAIVLCIFISIIIVLNISLWIHQKIFKESTSKILGTYPLIVESNSMSPLFKKGDLIFSKPINPAEVKVGDIISFENIYSSKHQIVTHRINKIINENGVKKYVTKGDANSFNDFYMLDGKCILGKYQSTIPAFGSFIKLIRQPLTLILLILIIVLFYLTVYFVFKFKKQRENATN